VAWPNPTAGSLRLRLDGPSAEGPLLATVRDAAGRTVRLERLDAPAGQVWTLRLDGLPEGWYPVELRAEDGRRWRVPVLVARP
jgi:hypothetical protein